MHSLQIGLFREKEKRRGLDLARKRRLNGTPRHHEPVFLLISEDLTLDIASVLAPQKTANADTPLVLANAVDGDLDVSLAREACKFLSPLDKQNVVFAE